MVSINKSFLYGIVCASTTWIISLYLYSQLTKNVPNRNSKMFLQFPESNNNVLQHEIDEKESTKSYLTKNSGHRFATNHLFKNLSISVLSQKPVNKFEDELMDLGLVKNFKDQEIKDQGYKLYAYNILISNRLSYHRSIPDTRHSLCKNLSYPKSLPTASIIICFYNEHLHTLIRTIHSLLDRTGEAVLHEIILIDDFSDLPKLHQDLQQYLSKNKLEKVKLYKTERREGLIRARIFGSHKASGEVLVFLDSHIEVNVKWLPPLLERIKQNRSNVVMPIIDIINPDTFFYSSSPLVRGGFNWGLHFKWENLPKGTLNKSADFVKPLKSPTMAGGLFAINRKYFIDIGEYDAGMNIWGGENLELSFRIWMCNGSLEIIPCSRVGHIFRHRRPYGSPDGEDTMLYNSLRVAHVWLDDYKEYFLSQNKQAKKINYGDISSRIQLRKELKCQDFDWYLKNIYPELTLPSDDTERLKKKWSALEQNQFQPWHSRKRNYVNQFQIRLRNTSLCIQSSKDVKSKGSTLILRPCVRSKKQLWYETDKSELVLAQLLCLQASKPLPILYKCHELGADQEWKHKGGFFSCFRKIHQFTIWVQELV
ncbi:polypeptide N-acetylgalactosaminyltransferase 35A-like isoform X2 [Cylas formicarius]|uniref:polypeptide N-acetylgalactosaminyltransferase 35A-like isoform X2 n=1 Tax=Cylas formicarius TaxID=197179 RepID=UPI00295852B6|nr:polypeptide N-acetylgalactosaminyltransferase 35A-like isoform X2 [Cylas formicarius]